MRLIIITIGWFLAIDFTHDRLWDEWFRIRMFLFYVSSYAITEPQLFFNKLPISHKDKNLIIIILGVIIFVAGIII